jgi:hypothetical protein
MRKSILIITWLAIVQPLSAHLASADSAAIVALELEMSRLLMAGRIEEYATHLTSDYARTTRQGILEGRDAALASWRARGPTGPTQPVDLWVRVYGDAAVLTGAIAGADTSAPQIRITKTFVTAARAVAAGGAPRVGDPAALTPNPRMQPTGRRGARLRVGVARRERAKEIGLCGRQLEGLQLMRTTLGGHTNILSIGRRYLRRRNDAYLRPGIWRFIRTRRPWPSRARARTVAVTHRRVAAAGPRLTGRCPGRWGDERLGLAHARGQQRPGVRSGGAVPPNPLMQPTNAGCALLRPRPALPAVTMDRRLSQVVCS